MNLKELNIEMSTFFEDDKLSNEQRIKIIHLVNQSYKLGYESGYLEYSTINEE